MSTVPMMSITDEMLAMLDQVVAGHRELNTSNYGHDDVCQLNDWGVDASLAAEKAAAALREARAQAVPAAAAQEPVATLTVYTEGTCKLIDFDGAKLAFSLPDGGHPLYTAPPAAEQPDHHEDALNMVHCACGDAHPASSFDAGFIRGSGMCQNCDASIPAKDIAAEQPDTVKVPRELLIRHLDEIGEYAWDTYDEMRALLAGGEA